MCWVDQGTKKHITECAVFHVLKTTEADSCCDCTAFYCCCYQWRKLPLPSPPVCLLNGDADWWLEKAALCLWFFQADTTCDISSWMFSLDGAFFFFFIFRCVGDIMFSAFGSSGGRLLLNIRMDTRSVDLFMTLEQLLHFLSLIPCVLWEFVVVLKEQL